MVEKIEQLHMKMTEAEKSELKTDAHKHEMTMSEYLRYLIEKERRNVK